MIYITAFPIAQFCFRTKKNLEACLRFKMLLFVIQTDTLFYSMLLFYNIKRLIRKIQLYSEIRGF